MDIWNELHIFADGNGSQQLSDSIDTLPRFTASTTSKMRSTYRPYCSAIQHSSSHANHCCYEGKSAYPPIPLADTTVSWEKQVITHRQDHNP